jgi:DNA-binding CsgD family transcriptional regulator
MAAVPWSRVGIAQVPALVERDHELGELELLLDRAADGSGQMVVLRGPAGIGKTRLLDAFLELAQERGATTLHARAGELERDFPFGCVRQLFEPLLRADQARADALLAGEAELARSVFEVPGDGDPTVDAGFGSLHGLYWLTANLADPGPLVLALDDAQWADPASLRFLAFLGRRLDGLRVVVVLTARPAEPGAEREVLPAIERDPLTTLVEPAPLSREAVEELVRESLGDGVAPDLAARCHEVTGGNPFLMFELLFELYSRNGSAPGPDQIPNLGPQRVAVAIESRLERVGPVAPRLATAVAVLGDAATTGRSAALASVGIEDAAGIVDALVDAGILAATNPLTFVHPLVRNAVYARIGPADRELWHRRAAAQLTAAGAQPEVVALHLLATEPTGRPELADTLIKAGESARARGAPEAAVLFMARALEEPPAPADVLPLLTTLGRCAGQTADPRAVDWLRQAIDLPERPAEALDAARALVQSLLYLNDFAAVAELCRRLLPPEGERDPLQARVVEWLVSLAQISPATREVLGALAQENLERVVAGENVGPRLLASAAWEATLTTGTAELVAGMAEHSFAEGLLDVSDAEAFEPGGAFIGLIVAERFDVVDTWLAKGADIVTGEGDARALGAMLALRAMSNFHAGRLGDALADIDLFPDLPGPMLAHLWIAATQMRTQVELGNLDAAGAMADGLERLPLDWKVTMFQPLVEAFAEVRLAQGDAERALAHAETMADWEAALDFTAGVFVPWRAYAAPAHAALGDEQRALELARDQVEHARRFGAPGGVGAALRVLGLIEGGEQGLATLREAVECLRGSTRELESARAHVDLGAALRRAGAGAEAREPIKEGCRLASRCGAAALEERGLDELIAAGARPRRTVRDEREALTPSELRVAQMAADGLSNKAIAQTLYVTEKTVESHLGHAYKKLGINSRTQLAGRLDG